MFRFYIFIAISAIMAGAAAHEFTFSNLGGSIVVLFSCIAFVISRRTYSRDKELHYRIHESYTPMFSGVILVLIAIAGYIISKSYPEIMPFRPLGIGMFVGGMELIIPVVTYCH